MVIAYPVVCLDDWWDWEWRVNENREWGELDNTCVFLSIYGYLCWNCNIFCIFSFFRPFLFLTCLPMCMCSSMDKGLNSQGEEFAFFQNLQDEFVIEIFTKLSDSNTPFDTLDDLKSLGQSSTVCKHFSSLGSLVPILSIKHFCCKTLYDYCPKILNKFKHISSLQVFTGLVLKYVWTTISNYLLSILMLPISLIAIVW